MPVFSGQKGISMNTVRNLALCVLLAYGGFMTGYFSRPAPNPQPVESVKEEERPKGEIDWTKFFDRIFFTKWSVTPVIGLTTDDFNHCEYTLYFVDGDRWIEVQKSRGVKGCGAPQSVNRFFVMLPEDFTNRLTRVPGKDARFVAVGLGNPKVVEQGIHYFNKETGQTEEDGR